MNKRDLGAVVLTTVGVGAATIGAAVVAGIGWALVSFGVFAFVLGVLLGQE